MNALDAAQIAYDTLALDDLGTPVDELEGLVEKVYLIEPRAGNLATPVSVTVSVDGQSGVELNVTVRVYGKLGNLDAITIQTRLVETWTAIDTLLDGTSIFSRGTWNQVYLAALDSFVAECPMIASRTDLI